MCPTKWFATSELLYGAHGHAAASISATLPHTLLDGNWNFLTLSVVVVSEANLCDIVKRAVL